jgi:type IV pilus assembly protein PilX
MTHPIRSPKTAQRGVVLFITLVVLVALALGALAMFRGSLGASMVATNVVYRQAALNLADNGVQLATAAIAARAVAGQINNDDNVNGYFSAIPGNEPTSYADEGLWQCGADSVCPSAAQVCNGNATCITEVTKGQGLTVYYKVHRMCTQSNAAYNAANNRCALTVKTGGTSPGGSLGIGATQFLGNPMIYFRITTRVDGPRNTRMVTQTVVALQT